MRKPNYILSGIWAVFSVACLFVTAQAKIVPMPLKNLVMDSQTVVVGKVSSISRIENVDFAKIEVLQVVKGNVGEDIYYSAERTWACDISRAVLGETALFFFDEYQIRPVTPALSNQKQPPPFAKTALFKENVEQLIGRDDLFKIAFSGHGRMPIENPESNKLNVSQAVILPKELKPELTEIINYTKKVLSSE